MRSPCCSVSHGERWQPSSGWRRSCGTETSAPRLRDSLHPPPPRLLPWSRALSLFSALLTSSSCKKNHYIRIWKIVLNVCTIRTPTQSILVIWIRGRIHYRVNDQDPNVPPCPCFCFQTAASLMCLKEPFVRCRVFPGSSDTAGTHINKWKHRCLHLGETERVSGPRAPVCLLFNSCFHNERLHIVCSRRAN